MGLRSFIRVYKRLTNFTTVGTGSFLGAFLNEAIKSYLSPISAAYPLLHTAIL